jgi:iturin family lipopeptide synthetase C
VPATIPIGCGIHNSRLYVLDAFLKAVPVGVPGQLFISGVQVSAGYLNRNDLTNEVFVPNPFCEGPGTHTDRMYRTGDLVRWLPGPHACVEFLGRVDHQVS